MTEISISRTDDEIYGHPLIYSQDTETFLCPVCRKSYVNQARGLAHLGKRTCAKAIHRFKDTSTEKVMREAYMSAVYLSGASYPITMPLFRASHSYTAFAKLMVFCAQNKIENPVQYSDFFIMQNPTEPFAKLLAFGCTDRGLNKYRAFLLRNPDLISSEQFFTTNQQRLEEDLSFALRAIERADISLDYLFTHVDVKKLTHEASRAQQTRLLGLGASQYGL